jgi:hypothetical protein
MVLKQRQNIMDFVKKLSMPFAIPVIWREISHTDDYYFCHIEEEGYNAKNNKDICSETSSS